PLPHQLLQRAFSLPPTPAIPLHGVILRHPPKSGRELWLNSPDLDAFSLFHQPRDTTGTRWRAMADRTGDCSSGERGKRMGAKNDRAGGRLLKKRFQRPDSVVSLKFVKS